MVLIYHMCLCRKGGGHIGLVKERLKIIDIDALVDPAENSGAIFDRRRRYRYLLWRKWSATLPAVSFVMLNPSAADEHTNDPTISRSVSLAQRSGFGSIFVVNLFAYMTKSPALLKVARDPVSCAREAKDGRHNDDFIRYALRHSGRVVLAWGNHGLFQNRNLRIITMLSEHVDTTDCFVFAMTKQGQPRHPLYTPKSIELQRAPASLFRNQEL